VIVSGTALLETFCQQEIHLQNPTSNPSFQVINLVDLSHSLTVSFHGVANKSLELSK